MGHSLYIVLNADSVKGIEELEGMISALTGLKNINIYTSPILICLTHPRQLFC